VGDPEDPTSTPQHASSGEVVQHHVEPVVEAEHEAVETLLATSASTLTALLHSPETSAAPGYRQQSAKTHFC
jgi:hypothetical protein